MLIALVKKEYYEGPKYGERVRVALLERFPRLVSVLGDAIKGERAVVNKTNRLKAAGESAAV